MNDEANKSILQEEIDTFQNAAALVQNKCVEIQCPILENDSKMKRDDNIRQKEVKSDCSEPKKNVIKQQIREIWKKVEKMQHVSAIPTKMEPFFDKKKREIDGSGRWPAAGRRSKATPLYLTLRKHSHPLRG